MHIVLIGTRGVPAAYGGFETAAEEVAVRLVAAGHEVTVYCRRRKERTKKYRGINTIDLPAIKNRSMETLSHTFLSIIHSAFMLKPDVAFVLNAANSPFLPLLRAAKIPTALHTDGLEWLRGKWGPMGKKYYLTAEAVGVHFADALISDADGVAEYYLQRYSARSHVITYGSRTVMPDPGRIAPLGLKNGEYHLVVARIEPENHVNVIIEGYKRSSAEYPLVVVGSTPYPSKHSQELESLALDDHRVRLIGGVWDQDLLDSLYAGSAVYLHGHSVGGTNPSLLRAMGAAAPVAAFDVSFNREVLLADRECYWRTADQVTDIVDDVERFPDQWRERGVAAQRRAREHYDWGVVANDFAVLAKELSEGLSDRSRGARHLGRMLRSAHNSEAGYGPWRADQHQAVL